MTDLTIDMVQPGSPKKTTKSLLAPKKPQQESDDKGIAGAPDQENAAEATCDTDAIRSLLAKARQETGSPEPDAPTSAGEQDEPACQDKAEHSNEPTVDFVIADEYEANFIGCMEECGAFAFYPTSVPYVWDATPVAGAKNCSATCSLSADTHRAHVTIDTGLRIRPGRIAAANQLAMLVNGELRVTGFDRIDADGAVTLSYDVDCDDPEIFNELARLALGTCMDALRPFGLVSWGSSPQRAFLIFTGEYDELHDLRIRYARDIALPAGSEDKQANEKDDDSPDTRSLISRIARLDWRKLIYEEDPKENA